ncbi:MAG: aminopeptidase P N-terminal domain-containing protein [Gemmatimonas sp.]|jgi:Xaa-Pro aminopeptidase|uniref:aminopeptidase P N-terminal domain-containing protein n=2 Tax=Gemmatimonas sp. TaxID=1962908 RepID=UPI0022C00DDF|nr:aminopeptidase P N-terminal domain-containing protein [Gemmatimonas sp.]MCE2954933.1 aminopeptidase P N-terminal domain-containing protein [Gemmatimonas sp.]MCZ8011072.1 aminopeptidase P N-terminal domain-containing protein [Gemmatimonas sp.]MCZ8266107.1 aminopeptidase P N-terminal domain-containing protein [Gemmatimonas sp.]
MRPALFRRALRAATGTSLLMASPVVAAAVVPATATAQSDTAITRAELDARRSAFAQRIGNGVVVAFGGRALVHDFSTFYQLAAFRYLTELNEPDHAFVMVVRDKIPSTTLFLTRLDPRTAFYYGQRTDSTNSVQRTGLPARSYDAIWGVLDSLVATGLPFYHIPDVETMDFSRVDTLTRGQEAVKALARKHPQLMVRSAMPHVLAVRGRKSAAELALIRKAVEISSEGHRAAMLTANPQHEYELRAALEYEFTRRGAERPAYGSIVGAGYNATTLHYMKDMDPVKPGDLVVMDAGAEYRGYAADVTRTIPVSGAYTADQRAIYQLVLDAQKAAERNSKPGMSIRAAADSSVAVRTRGLAALGLIESEDAQYDPPWRVDCTANPNGCKQANLWMIHGISHGIGLAVHDPLQGDQNGGRFAEGDAFTIEPGIYISTRALDVLPDTPRNRQFKARVLAKVKQYENTGVRIEDDYIITDKGLERISLVPREIDEIQALMKRRRAIQP